MKEMVYNPLDNFTLFHQMVKKHQSVQRQVSEVNLKLVSLDSFTCYVARFSIVRSFLSQGAFQLAGCLGPRGSADGGGDHDPGLFPWLLPGETHAQGPHGQQAWT